jgi:hypothetical protein
MRPGWFEWLWNVSTYCELIASGRRVLGEVLLGLLALGSIRDPPPPMGAPGAWV